MACTTLSRLVLRGVAACRVATVAAILLRPAVGVGAEEPRPPEVQGLPFNRVYSLPEIGNVSRGARLGFDVLGRIAVVSDGSVHVLNDATWIDIAEKGSIEAPTPLFVREIGGTTYYGGQGSWGVAERTAEGKLRPRSVVPVASPAWVQITNFEQILPCGTGICFSGWNGVVYWDRATDEHLFFPLPQVSLTFAVHRELFVSSLTDGIHRIDRASRSLQPLRGPSLDGVIIERATELADGRLLVATFGRELLLFDGQQLVAWSNQLGERAKSRVSDLVCLPDGGIALAIEGRGVFILSDNGELLTSLASPEYRQVTGLAVREPGVLWIATGLAVEKVLYDIPVEVFDQRLGVPIRWPQLVRWRGRIVIASNGILYESNPEPARADDGFRLVPGQPENGTWGIAAQGDQLLVANAYGIHAREPDGRFVVILPRINVDRLVMVSPDLCYVIGAAEITALRRVDGRWSECAARVPGVGYPTLVHAARNSAWIELGPNRAARVGLRDGRLNVRVFDRFPWAEATWIHVSVVGDTVAMCGAPKGRLYFDEVTEELVESPQLQRVFDASRSWITRLRQDSAGTYWASHPEGVFKIQTDRGGSPYECAALDVIKDRVPFVWVLEGDDIWVSGGYALYHVSRHRDRGGEPAAVRPSLVSVIDGRSGRDLSETVRALGAGLRLPFAQNSLTFRFFAGGYTSLSSPVYEFRMNGRPILGADSVLTLPDLREGTYHLEVRLVNACGPLGEPLAVSFTIDPPWYRTWYIGVMAVALGVVLMGVVVLWSVRRTRSRNLALERLVRERTDELRTAMQRLAEETRTAATLAERDRLAGEIHDSLQQGLSGLMLQLDATLKLPSLSGEVRSRLSVARNMVSFTRHEVQNAVWDLESPLLENADLGDALRKLAELIGSKTPQIEFEMSGPPRLLSSSARHHLLRIAQEAITNAVRHGAANRVTVSLHYAIGAVTLVVKDDGCGFLPQQVLTQDLGHFGLRGLRGRAGKINGDLQIDSEPGRGASIQIRVPTP
ncbi:MAG: sensor histidine kinase [Opitutaceae bacterium]|nr:sensor histidine kinase [Opitutaceae bacterium]